MTDNKAPSYPWYPRDFAADEPVQLMSLAEEGAYRRLLDHQWLHGSIPGDVKSIARICKNVSLAEMRRMWPALEGCFTRMEGQPPRLQNRKLERVRKDRQEFLDHQRESGSRGGKKRWEKERERQAHEPEYGEPISDPTSKPTIPLIAKSYPAVASASASAENSNSVPTEPAAAAQDQAGEVPHNRGSVMGLVVERLYFGKRPSEIDMATNASILARLNKKHSWDALARVVEGLAVRRDRGELKSVPRDKPVSLKWVNDADQLLNQVSVCEDAYYVGGHDPPAGKRGGKVTDIQSIIGRAG